jgi:hypothetical protein
MNNKNSKVSKKTIKIPPPPQNTVPLNLVLFLVLSILGNTVFKLTKNS